MYLNCSSRLLIDKIIFERNIFHGLWKRLWIGVEKFVIFWAARAFPLGYGLAERLDGVKRCLERADEAGGSVTGSGDDFLNEVACTFHVFAGSVASVLFFVFTSSISLCGLIFGFMSRMLPGGKLAKRAWCGLVISAWDSKLNS